MYKEVKNDATRATWTQTPPQVKKRRLAIIKAGSAAPAVRRRYGDFEEWLRQGLGLVAPDIRLVRVAAGEPLPQPEECCGVVVTGSHAMVTDELPWSVALAEWIPSLVAMEIPLLGICYGHQLLAGAMGGRVGYHSSGREIGSVPIEMLPPSQHDSLFASMPRSFPAHAFHAQTVLALPDGAVSLARNDFEPHHAFRIGSRAWGVQFHPEYTRQVMAAEIAAQANHLSREGFDPAALCGSLRETPAAASLLPRFAELIHG